MFTYFQPMANPHEGSRNRVENAEKEPATGNVTTNSARLCMVQNWNMPVTAYESNMEAGPAWYRAIPEATKRPVPVLLVMLAHSVVTQRRHTD